MPKAHKMLSIDATLLTRFERFCELNNVKFSHKITELIEQSLNDQRLPDVTPEQAREHEKWLAEKRQHRNALIAKHGEKKALQILMQEAGLEPLT